ncbi:mycothiol synthase [Cryobacterium mesophilum]|uniref:GNAT family N-acetyltransferase n=1 Tax=Terrimesophilobacter mesophilus TaxID=433647 RepID=A0A4R8V935_9MICO|nr:GNAT family N-acetyltransferase [Terrimesophilobacter mesophilus]MBB5632899.1 mycothiol synthase [Terrimesophilobacter mesophilus]TFB79671.1 GNAT family N-acetyltransferase [Terrimesophilobacter mesophilus]
MKSMTRLRDRVEAPRVLPVPESTDDIRWRPATADDVDALLDCARAIDAVDHPHFVTTREEIEEELGHSYVSLEHDSLLAVSRTGGVLAFGMAVLGPGQETLVRSILEGGVRPSERGKGIGRKMLAWQEARALQQFAGSDKELPGWMIVWTDERASATIHLAERAGFRIARYFLELRRDLSEPIRTRPLDGFEIVPFDAAGSEAARLARNDSFRDHWGSQPTSEENWNEMVARSVFRPDLSFLAIAPDGEVAGFVISEVNQEDFAPQGFSSAYINLVGVRRAHRGRGIAPALLTRTLEAVAAAGLEMAVLDVDAENPTGALGLYTGVGFTEANRSLQLNKEF